MQTPLLCPLLFAVVMTCLFGESSSQRSRNHDYDEYDSKNYSYYDSYHSNTPTNQRYDPYRSRSSRPPAHFQTTEIKLLHLDEDDVCRRSYASTEPDYVCRNVKNCIGPVTEAVKNNAYLDVCSFDGTQLVVCCPLVHDMTIIVPEINYPPKNNVPEPTTESTKPIKGTRPVTQRTQPTTETTKQFKCTRPVTQGTQPTTETTEQFKWTRPVNQGTEPTTGTRKPFSGTRPTIKATAPTPHSKAPTRGTQPTPEGTTVTVPPTKKPPNRVTRPQTVQGTTMPVDNTFIKLNTAAEKCRRYNKLLPKPYYASDAVGDGTETKPLEFPHMALLGYGETTELRDDWMCGGSLISERWILTSANCMYRSDSIARWARLGDYNVESTTDFAQPKDYRITKHLLHPDYIRSERYNDIALFQLAVDVEFSVFIRPICLNSDPSLNPSPQIVTGWGAISTDGGYNDKLMKVTLDIVPTKQCNASYYTNDDPQLKFGITEDSMICAGSTIEDEDACQGFSGGPLQTRDSQTNTLTYIQFGITSFGSAFCGVKENPGVYTRVAKYVPWIERTIW